METINHYIGGGTAEGSSGRYADVYNPALGEPCARVALASIEDVAAAHRDDRPLSGSDHPFGLGQPLGLDVGEFRRDAVIEGRGHVRSATPNPRRIEPPKRWVPVRAFQRGPAGGSD